MNDWKLWPPAIIRITIEVGGYRWKIHGASDGNLKEGLRWRSHLVELLGAERLDVPLDSALLQKIREGIAKRLGLEVETIKPISPDSVLAC